MVPDKRRATARRSEPNEHRHHGHTPSEERDRLRAYTHQIHCRLPPCPGEFCSSEVGSTNHPAGSRISRCEGL
ncbi:hypothetical protein KOW79_012248 [Hemibagrus wyckioides]|uniref:Uncharacterized protein n=1 Tax=Hemibagrus wyckioides TaxID=337641 RepID=A0A9D3SHD0_9TELE|nr:hypothetical protein KOW79_012248 [Hemibagrus wyckioides]